MVSHKEFLDEAYSKLAIGDVCDAVVAKILDGRLLVYLPDNELYATVSMSELSWSLEDTIADFCPGQQVRVRITKKGGLERFVPASVRPRKPTRMKSASTTIMKAMCCRA